ncbi:MAG: sterol desaturase family protein [Oligoflexales bacterium]|nr:sterol desaturase family protein [Oligoflexales bacterium]
MFGWLYHNFTYVSLVLFFLLMAIESLLSLVEDQKIYSLKDTWVNLSTGLFAFYWPAMAGLFFLAALHQGLESYALFKLPSLWKSFIFEGKTHLLLLGLLFLMDDFCYYWYHRISHINRFFWCIHEVHHSSEEYNFSVFFRASFLEYVFQGVFWVPLILIGFTLEDIVFQMSVSLFYQFLLHTKFTKKLPIFDFFWNTPSHHRVHHSINIPYLDKNFGAIFIIWDRIFGSFAEEKDILQYGVLSPISSFNPLKVCLKSFGDLIHDIANAPDWKSKLLYLWSPPGWTWDGHGKTTKIIQDDYLCRGLSEKQLEMRLKA